MESQKIYVGGEGTGTSGLSAVLASALQNKGIDPSVVAALGNGGLGGGWANNDLLGLIILFAVFGGGFGGFGGFGGNNGNQGREMIMDALNRNGLSLDTIAQSIGTSTAQVQSGINALGLQLSNMAGQNGITAQQIINSIQAGNSSILSQLCNGFCDVKGAITAQGYEGRIANLQQTQTLGEKIDINGTLTRQAIADQSIMINDKFCQQEMREMQNKIDALREERNELATTLETTRQTQALKDDTAAKIAPLSASIVSIQALLNQLIAAGATPAKSATA